MPIGLIFVVLMAAVAAVCWVGSVLAPTEDKRMARVCAVTASVFTVVLLFISCIQVVSTKNVGIETAFGSTQGELSNGLHFVAPWINVTEMDAAIQTDSYTGDNCLNVRIANQQTACVDVSIRWRIKPKKADELFQNYHTFENVRDSLVTRELIAAVNRQLGDYNPLNSVQYGAPVGVPTNPSFATIAQRVTSQMGSEIGGQIEVLNTIIPYVSFDSQTQSRINQLQQQIALTRIAEQAKATNIAQATANRALAASVNTSPNVLVAQCLTILQEMVKNGQAVPPGFSCWPGGSLTGVIANTGSKR